LDLEPKPIFTEEMRKTHTIIAPQMAPIHFALIEEVVRSEGYNIEILPKVEKEDIEEGLKYSKQRFLLPFNYHYRTTAP